MKGFVIELHVTLRWLLDSKKSFPFFLGSNQFNQPNPNPNGYGMQLVQQQSKSLKAWNWLWLYSEICFLFIFFSSDFSHENANGLNHALGGFLPPATNSMPSNSTSKNECLIK